MKSPNFVNPSAENLSQIGHDFSNNAVQKLKLSKNYFYKKCAPREAFFKNKNRKIRMIFNIEDLF